MSPLASGLFPSTGSGGMPTLVEMSVRIELPAQASKTATSSYLISEGSIRSTQREWHSNLLQTPLCVFLWNIPNIQNCVLSAVLSDEIHERKHDNDSESIVRPGRFEPPGGSIVRRRSSRLARPPSHSTLF